MRSHRIKTIPLLILSFGLIILFQNCSQNGLSSSMNSTTSNTALGNVNSPTILFSNVSAEYNETKFSIPLQVNTVSPFVFEKIECQISPAIDMICENDRIEFLEIPDGSYTLTVTATDSNNRRSQDYILRFNVKIPNLSIHISLNDWMRCGILASEKFVRCKGFGAYSGFIEIEKDFFVKIDNTENAVQVETAQYFACSLLQDKTVRCFGSNRNGQLGDGTFVDSSTAVRSGTLTNVKKITVASYTSCALTEAGEVWCWGSNFNSTEPLIPGLADGSGTSTPFKLQALTGIKNLYAGAYNFCAINSQDRVVCWGTLIRNKPSTSANNLGPYFWEIENLDNVVELALTKSWTSVCARTLDKKVYCFGDNQYGQLGVPKSNTDFLMNPIQITQLNNSERISFQNGICSISSTNHLNCVKPNYSNGIPEYYAPFLISPIAQASSGRSDGPFCALGQNKTAHCFHPSLSSITAPIVEKFYNQPFLR